MRRITLVWSSLALAACAAPSAAPISQNAEASPPSPVPQGVSVGQPGAPTEPRGEAVSAPGYAVGVKIYPSLAAAGRNAEIIGPIDAQQKWTIFSGSKPTFAGVTEALRGVAAQQGADGIVNPQCRRLTIFGGPLPAERVTCVATAVRVGKSAKAEAGNEGSRGARHMTAFGSGFFVNGRGDLVTNEHVVRNCTSISVRVGSNELSGTVISTDPRNDLALVRTEQRPPAFVELRVAPPVKLAEPVVAVGYPLPDMLAQSVHVTDGSVTALAGHKGNSSEFQISAPLQNGNSGGPLVDSAANLIGVNSSGIPQLRDGTPTQNVNFAIKTSAVTTFLDAATAEYRTTTSRGELRKTDIAARAERFTAQVICRISGS